MSVSVACPASEVFSTTALLEHLARDNATNGSASPVYVPTTLPKADAPIPLMEPELAAAATVPFASIASDAGAHLRRVLDRLGFAIVADVLSAEEVSGIERLWADDLRSIVDVDASTNADAVKALLADPVRRWDMKALPLGSKSAAEWGVVQGRAAWFARLHPSVHACFASLFGTDQLCTGTDCIFFNNAPLEAGTNAKKDFFLWPHADQNSKLEPTGHYECFQGILYVWPADADTSATVVWPRSHELVFPRLMEQREFEHHFCMLPDDEHVDFARHARRVPVPAGAMLLWNSRTIHQGVSSGPRLAFPVCHEPADRRDAQALERKTRCVREGLPTTHAASAGIVHPLAATSDTVYRDDASGIALRRAAHAGCVNPDGTLRTDIVRML